MLSVTVSHGDFSVTACYATDIYSPDIIQDLTTRACEGLTRTLLTLADDDEDD